MIKTFEKDMADTVEQMKNEKDRASIEIDTLKAQVRRITNHVNYHTVIEITILSCKLPPCDKNYHTVMLITTLF
jgi:hypothetical protein